MSEIDLFPGFERRFLTVDGIRLFARIGGSGPPLVLVHGFPQTHVEWHRIAGPLARDFQVVALDLRGYGDSDVPASHKGEGYSKRVMARDVVGAMAALGHEKFHYVGHDRGARVGYRLALDAPQTLIKLAVLDIVPTESMWSGMDASRAMNVYHWMFLAQREPMPETLIGGAPRFYADHTLASWTKTADLSAFGPPHALEAYRRQFDEPSRIHAFCEDYRAGATIDLALDRADLAAGRTIATPLLALWGAVGIPSQGASPLDIWRRWAPNAHGRAIDCGHFLPEEAPEATLAALQDFLR